MTVVNKHGERILGHGPAIERATLVGGPRDGDVLESVGYSLPSDIRYPVNGSNAAQEHRYTLRGTSATGLYFEFTGTVNV